MVYYKETRDMRRDDLHKILIKNYKIIQNSDSLFLFFVAKCKCNTDTAVTILRLSRHVEIARPPPVARVHSPGDPGHDGGHPHHHGGDDHGQAQTLGLVNNHSSQGGACNTMMWCA